MIGLSRSGLLRQINGLRMGRFLTVPLAHSRLRRYSRSCQLISLYVEPEKPCDQDYDNHLSDDIENVHLCHPIRKETLVASSKLQP
jgi:hypothetical protein